MNFLRRYPEVFILTGLAFLSRFWALFTPNAVVFDEVYFKAFAGDYFSGTYYFDIHPPLGKLALAGWAWLMHIDPAALINTTQATPGLRVLPALAGALIIPLFYVFLRQLGGSRRVATLGTALLLLDNALLVESRFILTDSLLILTGLGALVSFLAALHRPAGRTRLALLALAAFSAGLSASIKWTGLAAFGLIGVVWLADHIYYRHKFTWRTRITEGAILAIIPATVYVLTFWLHFALLTKAGPGDAFMSPAFQQTLQGNSNYQPGSKLSFPQKFMDLHRAMVQSEESLKTATHPYSSKWNTWPLMTRGIYYWQGEAQADGRQGHIYLLGNPFVWWGILVAIIGGALASSNAFNRLYKYRFALGFLALGYVMNFLPFIGIERVMFLYHYFFALILSLAFAVILIGALANWTDDQRPWHFNSPTSRNIYFAIIGVALLGFVYFLPLSYGLPQTPAGIQQHMWLPSWR